MSRRDYVTRDELEREFELWGQAFVQAVLKVLAPGAIQDPALAAARQRAEELRTTDPVLADQVGAVREARQAGAFVTVGADPGRRTGPGVFKVSEPAQADDESAVGSAQAAIRRRLRGTP